MKAYQNAFSSGMNNKNSPAKKFMACKRKQVKIKGTLVIVVISEIGLNSSSVRHVEGKINIVINSIIVHVVVFLTWKRWLQ